MKHKQTYFTLGSTFLVIFMMLGYVVKFYPEAVTGLDSSIQLSVRGDLPAHLTAFFKVITNFGHEALVFVYTFAIAAFFYLPKKLENGRPSFSWQFGFNGGFFNSL